MRWFVLAAFVAASLAGCAEDDADAEIGGEPMPDAGSVSAPEAVDIHERIDLTEGMDEQTWTFAFPEGGNGAIYVAMEAPTGPVTPLAAADYCIDLLWSTAEGNVALDECASSGTVRSGEAGPVVFLDEAIDPMMWGSLSLTFSAGEQAAVFVLDADVDFE